MGCCSHFFEEINPCQPWFRVKETSSNRLLDVPATFGPNHDISFFVGKLCATGFVISSQVVAWIKSPDIEFYYAYFTSWALAFALIYVMASLLNTLCPPSQPTSNRVPMRIRFTWVMFILAIFGQCTATLIFWTLVYDGGAVEYVDVATHGLVFVTVFVEGFYINRIPLRWMFLWLCLALMALFLIWSVIHGPIVLDLGNPNEQDNDPETNDDAIYASLSWDEDDITDTVILVAIVYFGVLPIIFAVLRLFSLWHLPCCCAQDRRRYVPTDQEIIDSATSENPQPWASSKSDPEVVVNDSGGDNDQDADYENGEKYANPY